MLKMPDWGVPMVIERPPTVTDGAVDGWNDDDADEDDVLKASWDWGCCGGWKGEPLEEFDRSEELGETKFRREPPTPPPPEPVLAALAPMMLLKACRCCCCC